MKTILFADTQIKPSGLLKCCQATITIYVAEHLDQHVPVEPLVISCQEEEKDSGNIILEDGTWRWNHATE